MLAFDVPMIDTDINTPAESAISVIVSFYLAAALVNLLIPDTGARYAKQHVHPWKLLVGFSHCCSVLWRDKLGQISLATTTLFWGAGATLQFIVLKWAETALGYSLEQATRLQGICALGIAIGAVVAAKFVPLRRAVDVVPVGVAMGLIVIAMIFARNVVVAIPLMVLIGGLAGFFVVPMNALLQHRGHILMGAGHSIAVQNFNENLSILMMLGFYALLIYLNFSIYTVIVMFGVFVSITMAVVRQRHLNNLRSGPMPIIPTDARH
jgi:hypothetical protein